MKFADFVCRDAIRAQLDATDKESTIREMVQALLEAGEQAGALGLGDGLDLGCLGLLFAESKHHKLRGEPRTGLPVNQATTWTLAAGSGRILRSRPDGRYSPRMLPARTIRPHLAARSDKDP